MARAKSTARAEARRRYRASQASSEGLAPNELSGGVATPDRLGASDTPQRRGMFNITRPDIRGDFKALPAVLTASKWMIVPFAMIATGFVLALLPLEGVDATAAYVVAFVINLCIIPPAFAPIIVGSFIAPRATYLVGGLLAIVANVAFLIVITLRPNLDPTGSVTPFFILTQVLYGALFGGFAGWYRNFLRENQRKANLAREERAREKKRQAKDEARQARSSGR